MIVLADNPLGGIHIQFVLKRPERDPVLGFIVDLHLRMVRTHVALATIVRMAGLKGREGVPAVTRRAGTLRPVGIDATDPRIRPGGRVELAAGKHLDFTAVALPTAADRRRAHTLLKRGGNQAADSPPRLPPACCRASQECARPWSDASGQIPRLPWSGTDCSLSATRWSRSTVLRVGTRPTSLGSAMWHS